MEKFTYFISDLHLGAKYLDNPIESERRVVRWLDSIKDSAKTIYLMGDILDYWYEYKYVVPRGFTRFFGKLAELSDSGIEITWFIGNHDIWIFDYLPSELGIKVIDGNLIKDIDGKRFFLSHGDGVGNRKFSFRLIRSLFRNKFCQFLFSAIHPRWTVPFAHGWSSQSRNTHPIIPQFKGEDGEYLFRFAREYEATVEHIDYFIFGHLHIAQQSQINDTSSITILGDWIQLFSFAIYDGKTLKIEYFKI
ncbi:MAG: UDP-2,3-diacylglucosamine diphosphatase [Muribaculaceae bacterium]